jgi:ABC-2 type transport system ATP-binding protein
MDEAAKLSDRVGIIDHGKLLALDTPAALTRNLPGSTTVSVTVTLDGTDGDRVDQLLSGVDGVERVERIARSGGAMPPGMPPGMPGGMPGGGMPQGLAVAAKAKAADVGDQGQFRLYTAAEPAAVLPAVLKVLGDVGCDVTDLAIGTPSLEDVFIHLTGRELR